MDWIQVRRIYADLSAVECQIPLYIHLVEIAELCPLVAIFIDKKKYQPTTDLHTRIRQKDEKRNKRGK